VTRYDSPRNWRSRPWCTTPKTVIEQAKQIQERYVDDRKGLEERVVRYVAAWPWKSFAEVATYMGLSGAGEVDRIMRDNRDLYRSVLMGLDEAPETSELVASELDDIAI
jgi:hypothetical protein